MPRSTPIQVTVIDTTPLAPVATGRDPLVPEDLSRLTVPQLRATLAIADHGRQLALAQLNQCEARYQTVRAEILRRGESDV